MTVSRGLLYMVASAIGFSAMSVLVKIASTRLPLGEIVLGRAVVTLVISYAMIRRAGVSPWGTQHGKLVFRGALGFVALAAYYGAIALLPIADATTIQQLVPLLTALLAWWLLGESIGWPTFFALACGIVGVVLIVDPGSGGTDVTGVLVAVGAAVCSSIAYVTVRTLAKSEHPLVIVFYFPLIAAPLALPWAIADWSTPSPTELLLLVAIGLSTQVGQVFLTMALVVEKVGRATSIGYLQIVFAIAWQLVIFGQAPAIATLAGAALIIGGTLVVSRFGTAAPPVPAATPPAPPA
ncbi:MAG TPA: DMT family transporter [Kofleriaceae bacterium]|nr:DMT family transporter [Kofleriaceae bacterium]